MDIVVLHLLVVWLTLVSVFFPVRGPSVLMSGGPLRSQGRHQGDWQCVTVRVSNISTPVGEPLGVFMSHHSGQEWVPWSSFKWADDKPLTVFVAHSSHWLYESVGNRQSEEVGFVLCTVSV